MRNLQNRLFMKFVYFLLLFFSVSLSLSAQEPIPIWPDNSPRKARKVTVKPYIAESSDVAIIVCPGGSYFWLDYGNEGEAVGRWMQQHGISAFVLKYRVPSWWAWFFHYRYIFRGKQHPDMYNDGQMALQWVHEHADEYGIDRNKIGMIGFSAGGHLVMSEACFRGKYRPAFVAPIYPVVTMSDKCVHKRSRRGLLGEYKRFNKEMRDSLSLEKHIPADCPPVFIVNCKDDPVVHYHNSELLDSALTQHGIPHKYLQYKIGGHGFAVSEVKGSDEARVWRDEFLAWLKEIKIF